MEYLILKIDEHPSRYGRKFYYIFFKGSDGKPYKTCVSPSYGNYLRCGWDKVIKEGAGNVVVGVRAIKNLIDADSMPRIIRKEILVEVRNEK